MTEQITLNLTLEELKLIDKYVELNNDTQQLFDKVKSAYPQPKMTLENEGDFSIVSCDGYVYYRLEYPTDVIWYNKSMIGRLEPIKDIKTKNELESQWLVNDVKYQNDEEPYCPDEPSWYDEVEHDISENVENKTLKEVINRWWMDTFTSKNMWSVNECIDDLADQVEFWILRNKK